MKQFYKPLCLIAAIAAMSLTSCQKENFKSGEEGTSTITVHATVEEVSNTTKTHIEGTDVLWDETEKMKIVLFGDSEKNPAVFSSDGFTRSVDGKTGTFTVSVNTTTHTKMAGVYPDSAAGWIESTIAPINLPSRQSATADSYDPAAYVMITDPANFQTGDFEWEAYYRRIAALNKFTLTNLANGVTRVVITFPEGQDAAGQRSFDLSTSEAGAISEGENTIAVSYASPLSSGANDIWFTSWSVSMNTGDVLTIRAETATTAYTKEFKAKKSGTLLLENWLNTAEFDMSGAKEENLTTYPEITDGEYWIMAKTSDGWKTAKPLTSQYGYLDVDDAADNSGSPVSTGGNAFTIKSVDGGYTIQDASGNYYYMDGDYNSFNRTSDEGQNGNVWSIKQTEDEEFTIVNVEKNKTMQYATQHKSFGAYSSISSSNILPYLVKAVYCDVTPGTLNVTADSGTTTFDVTANESWTIKSENPLYTVSPDHGTGNQKITVTYPQNQETSNVEVVFTVTSDSGLERTVTLTQRSASYVPDTITDVLTSDLFKATDNSYTNFSDVKVNSSAVYAGKTAKSTSATSKDAIQLRSKESDCGIVTTASNGKVKKIIVNWSSGTSNERVLQIFGSNEPYTSATELYDTGSQNGEAIAEIKKSDGLTATYEVTGDYSYIGFRSKSGAMYIDSLEITWEE